MIKTCKMLPRHKTPNYRQDRYGCWRPVLLRQTRKDLDKSEISPPGGNRSRRVVRHLPSAALAMLAYAFSQHDYRAP